MSCLFILRLRGSVRSVRDWQSWIGSIPDIHFCFLYFSKAVFYYLVKRYNLPHHNLTNFYFKISHLHYHLLFVFRSVDCHRLSFKFLSSYEPKSRNTLSNTRRQEENQEKQKRQRSWRIDKKNKRFSIINIAVLHQHPFYQGVRVS